MGRKKKEGSSEEPIDEGIEVEEQLEIVEEEPPKPIAVQQFIRALRKKHPEISAGVFGAFEKIMPAFDLESNYQTVWQKTFKRQ